MKGDLDSVNKMQFTQIGAPFAGPVRTRLDRNHESEGVG